MCLYIHVQMHKGASIIYYVRVAPAQPLHNPRGKGLNLWAQTSNTSFFRIEGNEKRAVEHYTIWKAHSWDHAWLNGQKDKAVQMRTHITYKLTIMSHLVTSGNHPAQPSSHDASASTLQPSHSSQDTPATTFQPQHSSHHTPATTLRPQLQPRHSNHSTPANTSQP